MSELTEQIQDTVTRLVDVQSRISELQEVESELKSQLRSLGQGAYDFSGGSLKLTQATKFDAVAATSVLTPAQIIECATTALDPAKVKERLTTEEIRRFSKPDGVLRVSVKVD